MSRIQNNEVMPFSAIANTNANKLIMFFVVSKIMLNYDDDMLPSEVKKSITDKITLPFLATTSGKFRETIHRLTLYELILVPSDTVSL